MTGGLFFTEEFPEMIVAKFGGTSMADTASICRVVNILTNRRRQRRVVVVSAAGVCASYPWKVTDLLITGQYTTVMYRLRALMSSLGVPVSILENSSKRLCYAPHAERVAFGEYMSARILAHVLGWRFVDACDVFTLDQNGNCVTVRIPWKPDECVIIPGFYGKGLDGRLRLFPRGGSDISGALLAAALQAVVYENWTDVDGVWTLNPRLNPAALQLPWISYETMEALAEGGAQVLHPECLASVRQAGIPVVVRNTFNIAGDTTIIYSPTQ